jgi:hypothetical protein
MPAFGAVLGLSSQALFFAVITGNTDKSREVGGRGIAHLERLSAPAEDPRPSLHDRTVHPRGSSTYSPDLNISIKIFSDAK